MSGSEKAIPFSSASLFPVLPVCRSYVMDDETPEMIMKKFEELERIKNDKTNEADAEGLDEATLMEVFKQTSTFNVTKAAGDIEADGMNVSQG